MLITGFVLSSPAPKRVLFRAIGPGLAAFGVGSTLPNPRVILYRGPTIVHENDDREASPDPFEVAAVTAALGAFPLARGSKDAAILATLAPGSYTALVTDVGGATGNALIEIYEVP